MASNSLVARLSRIAGDVPLASGRAWLALLTGTAFTGLGVGGMLSAGLGVSPLDALFSGVAGLSGWTTGTVVLAAYGVLLLAAWLLGVKPAVGTFVSFLGVGLFIDFALMWSAAVGVADWQVWARAVWWLSGLAVFAAGIVLMLASRLGASPYDQFVVAVSQRLHRSLGVARLLVDAVAIVGAFLLAGSWGVGTVVVLLVMPLVLNRLLAPVTAWVHPVADDSVERVAART